MSRSRENPFHHHTVAVPIVCMLMMVSGAFGQLPGGVKVTTSKLDGERQVQVTPGWLKGDTLLSAPPKLGGFWSDRSPTNFTLEAVLLGGGVPEKLKIGINGKISEFSPTGAAPGTAYNRSMKTVETSKRFEVPLVFVQEMVADAEVVVQVRDARGFSEAVFSADGLTRARPGFKKALEKIQHPEGEKNRTGVAGKSTGVK